MATAEEKQKELDALQAAFDEYIVSSRELEEELDADLTQCQNDLAKAESRNAALSSQLAAVRPQLASLEAKISALADRLSSETQRRVSAEVKAEAAENELRRSEGALAALRSGEVRKLKEENEELCERLAFLEGEVECGTNQRNAEKERHRETLEEMKGDLVVLKERLAEKKEGVESVNNRHGDNSPVAVADHSNFSKEADFPPPLSPVRSDEPNGDRIEYVQKLEDAVQKKLLVVREKPPQSQAEPEEALASEAPQICAHGGSASSATAAAGTLQKRTIRTQAEPNFSRIQMRLRRKIFIAMLEKAAPV